MIAKVIAFGSTRDEARTRLDQALSETKLLGTATNVEYLRSILTCKSTFLLSFPLIRRSPNLSNLVAVEISQTDKLVFAEFAQGKVTTSYLNTFEEYKPSCIEVIDGGLSTSIQDLRPRLLSGGDGVPRGGGFDQLAAKAANALAGNPSETEVIEATLRSVSLFRDSERALLTGTLLPIVVRHSSSLPTPSLQSRERTPRFSWTKRRNRTGVVLPFELVKLWRSGAAKGLVVEYISPSKEDYRASRTFWIRNRLSQEEDLEEFKVANSLEEISSLSRLPQLLLLTTPTTRSRSSLVPRTLTNGDSQLSPVPTAIWTTSSPKISRHSTRPRSPSALKRTVWEYDSKE